MIFIYLNFLADNGSLTTARGTPANTVKLGGGDDGPVKRGCC